MADETPEEKTYRDAVSALLRDTFEEQADDVTMGILLGVQLQESDPAVAQRFFRMMLRGKHDVIRATMDRFAASIRDW